MRYIYPVIISAFLFGCSSEAQQTQTYIVDAEFVQSKKDNPHVFIVDVRTPQEYAQGYIPGTDLNIPHYEIEKIKNEDIDPKKDTIIVYCRSGRRASIAYDALKKMGYKNVLLYKGSMIDWMSKKLPIETPQNAK